MYQLHRKGDYFRYKAEFSKDDERKNAAQKSLEAYKAASDLAEIELASTNAIRLGLALNFSVFYYEILNSPDRACRLAKTAFDEAIIKIETLEEDKYKDSTLIMQLLRDNLTLWTCDMQGDGELYFFVAPIARATFSSAPCCRPLWRISCWGVKNQSCLCPLSSCSQNKISLHFNTNTNTKHGW